MMINLQNKSLGYYIAAIDAILAIIGAIFFFATAGFSMPNNASGNVPETIGIFLLVGAAIEIAVLLIPQFRFVHIGAIIAFGLSLYKEILIIPNLIADAVNHVAYQGGSLPIHIVYISIQFIIVISAIVAAFKGFYKNEEDAANDINITSSKTSIIFTAVAAVLVVGSSLSGGLVSANLQKKASGGGNGGDIVKPVEIWDPITDDIKAKANEYEYDHDPSNIIIKQQESYDYNDADLKALSYGKTRSDSDRFIVYYFEGQYAEGYQGDYSKTYGDIYLWDDGLFAGKAKDTTFKGYWYNSSSEGGTKTVTNEETGETSTIDIADCLNMVSNSGNYNSIITEEAGGFYERQAYIYLDMGWGKRSMPITGYRYYPDVALFVDTDANGKPVTYKVGEKFNKDPWVATRVLKNLTYSAVYKQNEVQWNTSELPLDSDKKFTEAGEYQVKATWNGLEAYIDVVVTEE